MPASTTHNIRCPSIMTPSKMGKTKKDHFLFSNQNSCYPCGKAGWVLNQLMQLISWIWFADLCPPSGSRLGTVLPIIWWVISFFDKQKITILDHFIQFQPILDHSRPFWMGNLSKIMGNFKILAQLLTAKVGLPPPALQFPPTPNISDPFPQILSHNSGSSLWRYSHPIESCNI